MDVLVLQVVAGLEKDGHNTWGYQRLASLTHVFSEKKGDNFIDQLEKNGPSLFNTKIL